MTKLADSVSTDGPTPTTRLTTVHLSLAQKVAKAFVGKKPGQSVRLVIVGEITDISLREIQDDVKEQYTGDVDLEVKIIRVFNSTTEMEELMDDDE